MRGAPVWPTLEAMAHTLAYDAACLASGQPPTDRLARIAQPTLVSDRPPVLAASSLDEAAPHALRDGGGAV